MDSGGTALTHRNTEQAYTHLYTCDYEKDFQYSGMQEPTVCSERQAETEQVLEDKQTGERFNGDVAFVLSALSSRKSFSWYLR